MIFRHFNITTTKSRTPKSIRVNCSNLNRYVKSSFQLSWAQNHPCISPESNQCRRLHEETATHCLVVSKFQAVRDDISLLAQHCVVVENFHFEMSNFSHFEIFKPRAPRGPLGRFCFLADLIIYYCVVIYAPLRLEYVYTYVYV